MTRREALLSFIAGPFTAKGLAKLPAAPEIATPAPLAIKFIASGAHFADHLMDATRYALRELR